MPNLANAKKALRQSKKRAARNKVVKDELHSLRRSMRKFIEAGKLDEAKKLTSLLDKKVDKAIKRGIIKLNNGARIKSRYMKNLNAAQSAK
jgi:small subunit ribosomal protein S20